MEKKVDICIVGAGPIGGYIASNLAGHVDSLVLIEQHKKVGEPVNCAGLVTPRVFEQFNIPTKNIVQNEIKGANIHSPSGDILSIGGNKVHALSIDRKSLDSYLVSQAVKKNTSLLLSEKVLSIQRENDSIELATSKKSIIKCSCLIGSDGPHSKIRDIFGFPQPAEFLRGIGAVVSGVKLDPDYVEIFIGNNIAPGFFAWMIPISDDGTKARIGLCSNRIDFPPSFYFKKLFAEYPTASYLSKCSIECKTGGIIPIGPLKQTVKDNVLLAGDAAAQVKPTSGGGIFPGLLSASHCVESVKQAYDSSVFSQESLQSYHDLWRKDIGRELLLGMQFRKIFRNLSDRQFNKYMAKFKQPNIASTISEFGDIDYPSLLVKPLLKKAPSLLKLLPQIFR